jgi:hypothetical protein
LLDFGDGDVCKTASFDEGEVEREGAPVDIDDEFFLGNVFSKLYPRNRKPDGRRRRSGFIWRWRLIDRHQHFFDLRDAESLSERSALASSSRYDEWLTGT